MKILKSFSFVVLMFFGCENMTGSLDFSQKPVLLVYNSYNYDHPQTFTIVLSNTDNSINRNLVSEFGNCLSFTWFHNDQKFVYSFIDNQAKTSYVKVYDLISNSTATIWESKEYFAYAESISPNDRFISLSIGKIGGELTRELATINIDGSNLKIISDFSTYDPKYGSDYQIFFTSNKILYSISSDGNNLKRISPDTINAISDFDIDMKHQRITFSTYNPANKLYLTDYDGLSTKIIFDINHDTLTQHQVISEPKFSPEANRIVARRWSNYITVLNLSDLHFENYTSSGIGLASNPSWTPNGQNIVYALNANQLKYIFKLSLENRREEKLAEFENYANPIFELSKSNWIY